MNAKGEISPASEAKYQRMAKPKVDNLDVSLQFL